MDRDLLIHLPVVAEVARQRSFAAAAAVLGVSASAVSHAVRVAEDRIGLPLFARTTRSVSLTEAGTVFLATAAPALEALTEAIAAARAARGRVTGTLRLNAPRVALAIALTPVLAKLARDHRELTVEVTSDDAFTDIVAQGFDVGIRLGETIAQDMVAVRLTPPFQAIIVASPAYLAARGTPRTLADLQQHNCIGFRLLASGARYAWEVRECGTDLAVDVSGTVLLTDASYAQVLACAGIGIAYVFAPLVWADLAAGRLIQLLPQSAITEPGLFVYFPRHTASMPKLRAFLDAAKDALRNHLATAQPDHDGFLTD
jgi:DNA-binding transcriptional LysR family regulator